MAPHYFKQIIYLKNKRGENMDRYLAEERVLQNGTVQLYVVCDGVGSTVRGGEVANQVVTSLWNWFYALETTEDLWAQFAKRLRYVNDSLYEEEQEHKLPRGATTFSGLLFLDEEFFMVHLGDSRIYARDNQGWVQLTQDHVRQGAVTEVIPRSTLHPQCYGGSVSTYDYFFLTTDGLYRKFDWRELEATLDFFPHDPQFLAELTNKVLEQGEKDNITGIFLGTPLKAPAHCLA